MAIPLSNQASAIPSPPPMRPAPQLLSPPLALAYRRASDPDPKSREDVVRASAARNELRDLQESYIQLRSELYIERSRNIALKERLSWFETWHRIEKEKEKEVKALFRADSRPYYNELAPEELLAKRDWLEEETKRLLKNAFPVNDSGRSSIPATENNLNDFSKKGSHSTTSENLSTHTGKRAAEALVSSSLEGGVTGEKLHLGSEIIQVPTLSWIAERLLFWLVPISSIILFYYSLTTDYVLNKWSIISVLGALKLIRTIILGQNIEKDTRGYYLLRFCLYKVLFVRVLWPIYVASGEDLDWTDPNDSTRGYTFWGYYQYLYLLYIQLFDLVIAKSMLLILYVWGFGKAYVSKNFSACATLKHPRFIGEQWGAIYCHGVINASWIHSDGWISFLGNKAWESIRSSTLSNPCNLVGWIWLFLFVLGTLDLAYKILLWGKLNLFYWAINVTDINKETWDERKLEKLRTDSIVSSTVHGSATTPPFDARGVICVSPKNIETKRSNLELVPKASDSTAPRSGSVFNEWYPPLPPSPKHKRDSYQWNAQQKRRDKGEVTSSDYELLPSVSPPGGTFIPKKERYLPRIRILSWPRRLLYKVIHVPSKVTANVKFPNKDDLDKNLDNPTSAPNFLYKTANSFKLLIAVSYYTWEIWYHIKMVIILFLLLPLFFIPRRWKYFADSWSASPPHLGNNASQKTENSGYSGTRTSNSISDVPETRKIPLARDAPEKLLFTSPPLPRFPRLRKAVPYIAAIILMVNYYVYIAFRKIKAITASIISKILSYTWSPVMNIVSKWRMFSMNNIRNFANYIIEVIDWIPRYYWPYLYFYIITIASIAACVMEGLSLRVLMLLTFSFLAMAFLYGCGIFDDVEELNVEEG